VLDFTNLSGVDYSGLSSFSKIKSMLVKNKIHMVICGVKNFMLELERSGVLNEAEQEVSHEQMMHIFDSLNEALEWCENYLLFRFYKRVEFVSPQSGKSTNSVPSAASIEISHSMLNPTPRDRQVASAVNSVLQGKRNN
jgi:SulP family sulfate permease